MGSQKFSKIITKTFSKASQEVTLSISMRDRNHELIIYWFTNKLMRSDSGNCMIKEKKIPILSRLRQLRSRLRYQNKSTRALNPARLTARRKNHYDDFVTWTSAWMNRKGYVTSSYNVTHDRKITMTILLHIPKYSATVLHGLQPG